MSTDNRNESSSLESDKLGQADDDYRSLPVVDIDGLFSPNLSERLTVAKKLDWASKNFGFLYVSGHRVPNELTKNLQNCAEQFFALTDEQKQKYYIGKCGHHSGYVPQGEEQFYGSKKADAKEAFDVAYDLDNAQQTNPMQGKIDWPPLSGFKEGVKAYYQHLLDLSKILFRGFALGLDLDEFYFDDFLNTPTNQLRLIHYFDSSEQAEDVPGIGAHTDYEFMTILHSDSPGLQVLNKAGNWVDVELVPNAFIVNIGDMMELFTNGRYKATSHRVRRLSYERYSFPMFCSLDYETKVAPHAKLVGGETAKYEPLICGEHLLSQTIQTFKYLQAKVECGELMLPESARALSSFGHDALRDSNSG